MSLLVDSAGFMPNPCPTTEFEGVNGVPKLNVWPNLEFEENPVPNVNGTTAVPKNKNTVHQD